MGDSLSRSCVNVLKEIKEKSGTTRTELNSQFKEIPEKLLTEDINHLKKLKYIEDNHFDNYNNLTELKYTITPLGSAQLENYQNKQSDRRRFWIPVAISIIALISSFRKEIAWLLNQLMQLWK